jgi:hypothetical protein
MEEIDRLKPLAELVDLERRRSTMDWNRTWELPAIGLITLVVGVLIVFSLTKGPPETEIDLESRSTSVWFTVDQPPALFENLPLSRIVLNRVQCVYQHAAVVYACRRPATLEQVTFDTDDHQDHRPSLSISSLHIPARSRIKVEKRLYGASYTIEIRPPATATPPPIVIVAAGTVIHAVRGTASSEERTPDRLPATSRTLILTTPLKLTVVPRVNTPMEFGAPFRVSELALSEDRELDEPDQLTAQTRSSVVSGSVVLNALGGKRIELQPYDALRFVVKSGEVRELFPEPTNAGTPLVIRFHGDVGDLTGGSSRAPTSLMPTWIDWVMENRQLSNAKQAIIFLVGAALSALTMLGIRKIAA